MANTGVKPTVTAVAGGIFLYSGIRNLSISSTLRELFAGRNPAKLAALQEQYNVAPGSPESDALASGVAPDPTIHRNRAFPTPAQQSQPASERAATNQAIAKPLAALYGWTEANGEWQALVTLWNNESGWSQYAYNQASGATGIPQAVPGTKMPVAAQAPHFGARAQIIWGLSYIKGRYGKPSKALTFWSRTDPRPYPGHWY